MEVPHESIADEAVQERRENKQFTDGRWLHDFANLYFWPRNGMMYRRRDHAGLCVVGVSTDVLALPGVLYSDRNAATDAARFGTCEGDFDLIEDADKLYKSWFGDPERKPFTQAEVLVPELIERRYIEDIKVDNDAKRAQVEALNLGIRTAVKPHLFFLRT